jgi:Ras family protein A
LELPAKVVIVGDGAIGKTCLLTTLVPETKPVDWANPQYIPTAAKNHQMKITTRDQDGSDVEWNLEIWDTAGQEALQNLRTMAYPETKVFLVGYDMTKVLSLENITSLQFDEMREEIGPDIHNHFLDLDDGIECWMAEIAKGCSSGGYHVILIGTKYDLWDELTNGGKDIGTNAANAECTTWEQGYQVAQAIGAKAFFVTSAKTGYGISRDYKGYDGAEVQPDDHIDPANPLFLADTIADICMKDHQDQHDLLQTVQKVAPVAPPTPDPVAPEPAAQPVSSSAPAAGAVAAAPSPAAPQQNTSSPAAGPAAGPAGGPTKKEGEGGGCCVMM